MDADELAGHLEVLGPERGALVGLTIGPDVGVGLATRTGAPAIAARTVDPADVVRLVEATLRPRWTLWSQATRPPPGGRRPARRDRLGPRRGCTGSCSAARC